MHVVVVGAGLSGLACAYRLSQAGCSVTVLEGAGGPGGRAQTVRRDGYVVDVGPDAMTAGYTRYIALLSELGFGDRVGPCSPVIGMVRDGRIHDLHLRRPIGLGRSPALSLTAKVRLVRGYLGMRGMLRDVDPYELVKSARFDDPAMTADAFGRTRFGDEITDRLIDPAMRLVTTEGASRVSVVNLLGAFSGWLAPLVNVRGGLDLLPHELAARLDVRYGLEATAVEESGAGVVVHGRPSPSAAASSGAVPRATTFAADHCVVATMYDAATRIWPELVAAAPDFAERYEFVQLITVTLGYSRLAETKAYAVQVPTIESHDGLLMLVQHNKAPDRAPAGHSLMTVYTDNAYTPAYLDRSDAELEAWGAALVERWCPELAGRRDFAEIGRWPRTAYRCDPGYWRRTEAMMAALPSGRVHLAGDVFNASSMEAAVRAGERAAERICG